MSAGASSPAPPAATARALPFGALVAFALALAFQLPFFDRWFSPMDEGHMLYFAELVRSGGQLYRDATIYPLPGAFYLLAGLFELFGPSILVSRWIVTIEFAAFVALLYALLRGAVPRAWASAGVAGLLLYRLWAFPHWQMYSYSTTALLLLALALLLAVRSLESGGRGTLRWAGLCFGLGVFCKQDYGAAALLAISTCLVVGARTDPDPRRPRAGALLASFLVPATAVGAAAGVFFLWRGMLGDVVQFTVLNHFIGLSSYEYPAFPSLLPLFQQDPAVRSPAGLFSSLPGLVQTVALPEVMKSDLYQRTALYDLWVKAFIFGPRLLIAFGALRLWRGRRELSRPATRRPALRELSIWSLAAALMLLAGLYRPQDYVHLAVLYAPLLLLLPIYGRALARSHPRVAAGVGIALAAPLLLLVCATGWLGWNLRTQHSEPVGLARAGVFVKPDEAALLRDAVAYIEARTRPDETVAVVPYYPVLHFLTGRPGPHGASYIVWPFPEFPDRDQRVIAAMERQHTGVVIYNFTEFPAFPPAWEYAPELIGYLVDHFEIDRVFSHHPFGQKLVALRRSHGPAPGTPIHAGAGASLSVRGADGREHPVARPDEYVRETRWPFRRVIALRPSLGGEVTELGIPLVVPPGASLRTALGVHPSAWYSYPKSSVTFTIGIEAEGVRETLLTRELDPHIQMADRGWFDVELPLDAWAGRAVRLLLETSTERSQGERLEMGGFGDPRMVRSPGAAVSGVLSPRTREPASGGSP